jgi:hypothetical protein
MDKARPTQVPHDLFARQADDRILARNGLIDISPNNFSLRGSVRGNRLEPEARVA